MNLTPTELDRLTIFSAAELARRYRSLGIRLSRPEAVALICDEVLTAARRDDGGWRFALATLTGCRRSAVPPPAHSDRKRRRKGSVDYRHAHCHCPGP